MINKIEAPTSNAPPYETVPFLEELNDQSREKLRELGFTVKSVLVEQNGINKPVSVLHWQSIEEDAQAFADLLIEATGMTIGNLSDPEFRDQLYLLTELKHSQFETRKVGIYEERENVLQDQKKYFIGRLNDLYLESQGLIGVENDNLVKTAPGHTLAAMEHMLWVPAILKLDDLELNAYEKRIARFVAIFHDFGKAVLERNGQHPEIGAAMVQAILLHLRQTNPELYPLEFINQVCWSINMHHMLERIFQPLKPDALEKMAKESHDLWPYVLNEMVKDYYDWWPTANFSLQAAVFQSLLLLPATPGSLERNENEQIFTAAQFRGFIELIHSITKAQADSSPQTRHALNEFTAILKNPSKKNVRFLLSFFRVIEADILASHRETSELTLRLKQLWLILQGILAVAEA